MRAVTPAGATATTPRRKMRETYPGRASDPARSATAPAKTGTAAAAAAAARNTAVNKHYYLISLISQL